MKKDKKNVFERVKQLTSSQDTDLIKKISTISERAEKARLSSTFNQTKFYKV